MKRLILAVAVVGALVMASVALAQSGHFIGGGAGAPNCTDLGTQVTCTGKVAGLGGETFEITIEAQGIASVDCINPAGHHAPGQDTAVTVPGTTGPLPTPQNGRYVFSITTDDPEPLPPTPTCPNDQLDSGDHGRHVHERPPLALRGRLALGHVYVHLLGSGTPGTDQGGLC